MEDLKDVYLSPLPESKFVRPFRFNYTQNGKEKTWDMLDVHDSVAIIVFNISRKVMVLVKQFRPAVYLNCVDPKDRKNIDTEKYPASLGITLEVCAGLIDKNKAYDEIASEEVLEECGYKISYSKLERITTYRSGVGEQGAKQIMFYCEVTDNMKVGPGGGIDDEIIDLVEMTIPEIEQYVSPSQDTTVPSPPSTLFGLLWFLHKKSHLYRN